MTAPNQPRSGASRRVRTLDPGHRIIPLAQEPSDLSHLIDSPVEAMVIGTVMTEGEPAYGQVRFLSAADFGVERHRIAWRAIVAVADEVHPTLD